MFKVNNKNTRTISLRLSFSSVSIVESEQVNIIQETDFLIINESKSGN